MESGSAERFSAREAWRAGAVGVGAAVEVAGLEKSFHVPPERYTTLRERLVERFRSEPSEILHAVRGVDLEVRRGEFFGIVGPNGSGKSTVLRCIAGIYEYEAGRIEVAGRLAPFVELGAGFDPDLNARDNAVLGAVLLGATRSQAKARVDGILAFAGLERFAKMKLRNFSAGMMVRLGFSVAAQVDADVLLVDEVMAVGDADFRRRSFAELERFKAMGRTIVYVTHAMGELVEHCDRALLMEDGRIAQIGDPREIAGRYEQIALREERGRVREAEREESVPLPPPGPMRAVAAGPATYRPAAVGEGMRQFASLTVSMALNEFRLKYRDSALGYLWSVMRPAIQFLVLYAIFSQVTQIREGVPHYPVYLATSLVLWIFFTETVSAGVTSLSRSGPLLRKMRFPRLALPLSLSLSALINLAANTILVATVVVVDRVEPSWGWLEMPLIVAGFAALATGAAMLFAALYVRYRDMLQIWQVAQQGLFFASPIIYVAKQYPDGLEPILTANPIAVLLTQMRHAFIDPSAPTAADSLGGAGWLAIPVALIAGTFVLGMWLFAREAPRVAERI